jgi:hypothetical protein
MMMEMMPAVPEFGITTTGGYYDTQVVDFSAYTNDAGLVEQTNDFQVSDIADFKDQLNDAAYAATIATNTELAEVFGVNVGDGGIDPDADTNAINPNTGLPYTMAELAAATASNQKAFIDPNDKIAQDNLLSLSGDEARIETITDREGNMQSLVLVKGEELVTDKFGRATGVIIYTDPITGATTTTEIYPGASGNLDQATIQAQANSQAQKNAFGVTTEIAGFAADTGETVTEMDATTIHSLNSGETVAILTDSTNSAQMVTAAGDAQGLTDLTAVTEPDSNAALDVTLALAGADPDVVAGIASAMAAAAPEGSMFAAVEAAAATDSASLADSLLNALMNGEITINQYNAALSDTFASLLRKPKLRVKAEDKSAAQEGAEEVKPTFDMTPSEAPAATNNDLMDAMAPEIDNTQLLANQRATEAEQLKAAQLAQQQEKIRQALQTFVNSIKKREPAGLLGKNGKMLYQRVDIETGAVIETEYLTQLSKNSSTGALEHIRQNTDTVSPGLKLGLTDDLVKFNQNLFKNTPQSYWQKVSVPPSVLMLNQANAVFDSTVDKDTASSNGGMRKDIASKLPKNKLAMLNVKDPLNTAIVEDIKQARVMMRAREYSALKLKALSKCKGKPVNSTNIINEKIASLKDKKDLISRKQVAVLTKGLNDIHAKSKKNMKNGNNIVYKSPAVRKIEREMKKKTGLKSKSKSNPATLAKCKNFLNSLASTAVTKKKAAKVENKKISEASPVSTEKPVPAKKVTFSQANLFGKIQFM